MQSPVVQALAELDAARARVDRDAARVLDETRAKLVAELLPVLDNLDRAIAAGRAADTGDELLEGVTLVRAQLSSVLRGYGLERFDATDELFDPRLHEAISVMAVDDPVYDGVVVKQWEAGYQIGARLLRPAKVIVGRFAGAGVSTARSARLG